MVVDWFEVHSESLQKGLRIGAERESVANPPADNRIIKTVARRVPGKNVFFDGRPAAVGRV